MLGGGWQGPAADQHARGTAIGMIRRAQSMPESPTSPVRFRPDGFRRKDAIDEEDLRAAEALSRRREGMQSAQRRMKAQKATAVADAPKKEEKAASGGGGDKFSQMIASRSR